MTNNKNDILITININAATIKKLGAKRIGIFGSFLHNNNHAESDVDLIVEFENGKKNFSNYTGLYQFLTEILRRKIDFLTPESLSPYLESKILKDIQYVSFN